MQIHMYSSTHTHTHAYTNMFIYIVYNIHKMGLLLTALFAQYTYSQSSSRQ